MSQYAVEDEALEAEDSASEDDLGDGGKTSGTNWINPDTQP